MLRHKGGLATPTSGDVAHIADGEEVAVLADRFRDLFKDTQSLPGAATLTDAEIAAEVDTVREGRVGQVPGKSRCIR
ncbi:MAG: hypothetical protein KFB96_11285 [Thiocapsa sp.]|uniref:hypothetical protein n=1 Tax=Thiocapsa sp. TaxID=2024551 RepID=UPI001BCBAC8D|nr:hypothetical protein [Thiocapsa sp.]QVL50927.1 MAG: hypothetical protein KFB96_11285 [Thiocapsa sp.]